MRFARFCLIFAQNVPATPVWGWGGGAVMEMRGRCLSFPTGLLLPPTRAPPPKRLYCRSYNKQGGTAMPPRLSVPVAGGGDTGNTVGLRGAVGGFPEGGGLSPKIRTPKASGVPLRAPRRRPDAPGMGTAPADPQISPGAPLRPVAPPPPPSALSQRSEGVCRFIGEMSVSELSPAGTA